MFLRRERAALGRARVVVANSRPDPPRCDRAGRRAGRPGPRRLLRHRPRPLPPRPPGRAGGPAGEASGGRRTARWSRSSARWATAARASTPCSRPGRRLCRSAGLGRDPGRDGPGAERRACGSGGRPTPGLADRVRFLGFRARRAGPACGRPTPWSPRPGTRRTGWASTRRSAAACRRSVSADAGVAERYPPDLADLLLPDPEDAADLAARLERWRRAARPPPGASGRSPPNCGPGRGTTWPAASGSGSRETLADRARHDRGAVAVRERGRPVVLRPAPGAGGPRPPGDGLRGVQQGRGRWTRPGPCSRPRTTTSASTRSRSEAA